MTPYLEMSLNNAWANATLYRALAGLDDADFAARRPGFFPSLSETMNHIHAVDLYYIDALEELGWDSVWFSDRIVGPAWRMDPMAGMAITAVVTYAILLLENRGFRPLEIATDARRAQLAKLRSETR